MIRRSVAIAVLALLAVGGFTLAAVPSTIRVQGYLVDRTSGVDGVPFDGAVGMMFLVYDLPAGGAPLAVVGPLTVTVDDGGYEALLSLDPTVFEDGERWIELVVDGETLSPRLRVSSVPYAYEAATVGGRTAEDLDDSQAIADAVAALVPISGGTMLGGLEIETASGPGLHIENADTGIELASPGGTSTRIGWDPVRGAVTFDRGVSLGEAQRIEWPMQTGASAGLATFSLSKRATYPPGQSAKPDGEADETWMFCYNCQGTLTVRADPQQHAWNQKFEANFYDGRRELMEVNWNYTSPSGLKTRPFSFALQVTPTCVLPGDPLDRSSCESAAGRAACEGAGGRCLLDDTADMAWNATAYGVCSDDYDVLCKVSSGGVSDDCAGSCIRTSDFQIEQAGGIVSAGQGLIVNARHPGILGHLRPSGVYVGSQTIQEVAARDPGTSFYGAQIRQTLTDNSAVDASDLVGLRIDQRITGSATPERGAAAWVSFEAIQLIDATSPSTVGVTDAAGFRWRFRPQGSGMPIARAAGFVVSQPAVTGTQPVSRIEGIRIEDMAAAGAAESDALLVEAQGDGAGDRGNLRLAGGGALDGHVVLGNGALWWDDGASVLRVAEGAPASDADGTPVHAPAGMSGDWGEVLWGRASGSANTAAGVCAAADLDCERGFDPVTGSDRSCSYSNWQGGYFMAFCR